MQIARVVGDVVATRKDENLSGLKLLILQPLTPTGEPVGRTLVAVRLGRGGSRRDGVLCAWQGSEFPVLSRRSAR